MNYKDENDSKEESFFSDVDDSSQDSADFNSLNDSDDDSIIVKEKDESDKGRRNVLITAGVGAAVLAGLLSYGLIADPFGIKGTINDSSQNKRITATQTTQSSKPKKTENADNAVEREAGSEWFEQEKNKYPVSVDDWAKTKYSDNGGLNKNRDKIIASRSGTPIAIQSVQMPSESAGFTSDPSKEFKSDGTLNPFYSFWTSEDFQSYSNSYLERLLNPEYGGWSSYQFSAYPANETLDFDGLMSDMFTDSFISANQGKKYSEYVPIFADWNGNNYGMNNLLPSGSRWFGKTSNENVIAEYDSKIQQYIVHYDADVKFTAWNQDQSKSEKSGKLQLVFVANDGKNVSKNKVLIDQAKLTMDGE